MNQIIRVEADAIPTTNSRALGIVSFFVFVPVVLVFLAPIAVLTLPLLLLLVPLFLSA